jgi:hypothetical protein
LEVSHEILYFLKLAYKQDRDIESISQDFNKTLTDSYNFSVHIAHDLKAQLKKKKLHFEVLQDKFVKHKSDKHKFELLSKKRKVSDIDQDPQIDSGSSPKLTCKPVIEHRTGLADYKIPLWTDIGQEYRNREQEDRKSILTKTIGNIFY